MKRIIINKTPNTKCARGGVASAGGAFAATGRNSEGGALDRNLLNFVFSIDTKVSPSYLRMKRCCSWILKNIN